MERKDLPPRGQPTGGFKDYSDCHSGMSVTCCRPDCRHCHMSSAHGRNWATEEALFIARFFQERSKQFHASRPLPKSVMDALNHFDPNMNAHASMWNWTRINERVDAAVKKFWELDKIA